jgi:hypothetical protein
MLDLVAVLDENGKFLLVAKRSHRIQVDVVCYAEHPGGCSVLCIPSLHQQWSPAASCLGNRSKEPLPKLFDESFRSTRQLLSPTTPSRTAP